MRWSDDFQQAEWIANELDDLYEGRVASVVPRGFEAYARVFHPFPLIEGANHHYAQWSEISPGQVLPFRRASFSQILAITNDRSAVGDSRPLDGTLTLSLANALIDVLSSHVATSETCWFAVWDGFWWQRDYQIVPREVLAGGRLRSPRREYLLFSGSLRDATVFMSEVEQSPNLWWPESRTWIVGTDIDLESTYVGGPAALIDDLLGDDRLETEVAYADEMWHVEAP